MSMRSRIYKGIVDFASVHLRAPSYVYLGEKEVQDLLCEVKKEGSWTGDISLPLYCFGIPVLRVKAPSHFGFGE